MRKRTLALLLALVLALSAAAFAAGDFTDVSEDTYYAGAVVWAAEKDIIDGMDDGIFDPEAIVTRAQAVTFLWRMAGEPEPTETETFADVEADEDNWWYKTAVQWAFENGITIGTGEGFSPYVTCSRGMILTMLYRMAGEPLEGLMDIAVPEDSSTWTETDLGAWMVQSIVEAIRSGTVLSDVESGAYYELPIVWAMLKSVLDENQIGEDSALAGPDDPCPRGEMVYFLYRSSDEGAPAAPTFVEVGTIPETAALDAEGVNITVTGITAEGTDAIVNLTVENGSDKLLRVGADDLFLNTYSVSPQVCIPVQDEENGWTFFADAVVAPGETADCFMRLNSLTDKGIFTVAELEFKLSLEEVEEGEYGYDFLDDFAEGETLYIQTSLYDESASYDQEGILVYNGEGLELHIVKAVNDEFNGPQIAVYACNSGSEEVSLEIAELKLDGETFETFFNMSVPAGKRSVEDVYISFDFDDVPVVKEAEITFCTIDPETWEPAVTFDPVAFAVNDADA